MKEFDWNGFKDRGFGMKCNTESEAKDFIKIAYKHGFEWSTSDSSVTHFKFCENYTVYYGKDGHLTYWSDSQETPITEWSDYMNKKLNIIEAMKMPIGTKFEVILNAEKYGCLAKIIESKVANKKQLVWDNRADTQVFVTDVISRAIFVPIQEPVSFMEAVESGKKVKVDYSDIDTDDNHTFSCEDYRNSASLIFDIVNKNGNRAFKEIILNGKWYIEN